MATKLKHLKMSPKEAHTATIIFLHGLGDSGGSYPDGGENCANCWISLGHGWLPVAKMLWTDFPGMKWILPHAPEIPITINGGRF